MNSIDYCSWENISCKHILKNIFSYLKVPKALKMINSNKKIRTTLEISLYHYQYYYFFILFKLIKVESINDILYSHYLNIVSEDVRYYLALNLIKKSKLFKDEYVYLNIDDKLSKNFIRKIQKKQIKNNYNYILGNIEEKEYNKSTAINYNISISHIFSMDIIDKILFDYNFFENSEYITCKYYFQHIKFLHINIYPGKTYNISLYNNLEYLSITLDLSYKRIIKDNMTIKIIISEKQTKNLKTLKIIESKKANYTINNIFFETENNKDTNLFENLKELHISEELLNKIKFNAMNLQKLNIMYDFRDKTYSIDYLENSFNNLLEQYFCLTNLNISFYYKPYKSYSSNEFIQEISDLFFLTIKNIEKFSLNFWDLCKKTYYSIKNLPNKKFSITGNDIPVDIFQNHFQEIEKIDLTFNGEKKCYLYIEESNSISALKHIRIKNGADDTLYIPIQSFSSLNSLELNIDKILFHKDFPLFSKDSSIQFNNLEYIALEICSNNNNSETIDLIALANNLPNVPNLKVLSIICKYISNTVFPYHREIISKIQSLKKLHTLIIEDNFDEKSKLYDVNKYYSIFPELKNTNIKFCSFSYSLYK